MGLKNSDSDTKLYIYDETNNKYSIYEEAVLDKIKLYPLQMDKEFNNYTKTKIKIGETEFDSQKINNSDYYIIHAKNLDDGKTDYYLYDSKT